MQKLALEQLKFIWNALPFVGICESRFALIDVWPDLGEFLIKRVELILLWFQVVFVQDGIGRTFGLTQTTVNALVGMNDEEIRALIEAIYRANIHTVRVFTANAVFGYQIGHWVYS